MMPTRAKAMLVTVIFLIMIAFIALAWYWSQTGEPFKAWIDIILAGACLGLIVIVKEYG